jgi:hypothetical protein
MKLIGHAPNKGIPVAATLRRQEPVPDQVAVRELDSWSQSTVAHQRGRPPARTA